MMENQKKVTLKVRPSFSLSLSLSHTSEIVFDFEARTSDSCRSLFFLKLNKCLAVSVDILQRNSRGIILAGLWIFILELGFIPVDINFKF